MTKFSKSKRNINRKSGWIIILVITGVEFFWGALQYLRQASEQERAVFLGLSLIRLVVIIILITVSLAAITYSIRILKNDDRHSYFEEFVAHANLRRKIKIGILILGFCCWMVYFASPHWLGNIENYILAIKPLLGLGILLSIQTIIFITLMNPDFNLSIIGNSIKQNQKMFYLWGCIFSGFLLLWGYISLSRHGIAVNGEDFWYEAGIPVLGLQIIAGIFIGLLTMQLENRLSRFQRVYKQLDWIIAIFIWVVGGILWAQTPVPNGYFNPGPYPPTNETYPFSDAARFDLMSQYALIGQGLNDGGAYNRPAYPTLLVFIHMISGQNYENNMQLQAALYAIFPVLVYLIARLLLDRGAGIALSAIILMRGINGIAATNMLNLGNQKQMLTDFPTAIGLAAILLVCVLWVRNPQKLYLPLLAGGLFGLTIYLRQTILGILPFVLILPTVRKMYSWKMKSIIFSILILGMLTVTFPYEFKHYRNNDSENNYPLVIRKIIAVIVERYPQFQKHPPANNKTFDSQNRYSIKPDDSTKKGNNSDTLQDDGLGFIEQHFLHNVVTSVLVLPNSFAFEDLGRSIRADGSYWKVSWDGKLSSEQSLLLILNLLIISIGVTVCVSKSHLTGLLPLLFFAGYNAANALGRTSGGRYIVPADWLVILYFTVGLFQICVWILGFVVDEKQSNNEGLTLSSSNQKTSLSLQGIGLVFPALLLAGILLIIPDYVFPPRLEELSQEQLQQSIFQYDLAGNETYLQSLLNSDRNIVVFGKIMYPRYYQAGMGEITFDFPYKTLDYPRLAFYLIGNEGTRNILLTGPIPKGLTNGSNAIIVGCREKDYIDATAILFTDPDQKVYFRDPLPEPDCRFPTP